MGFTILFFSGFLLANSILICSSFVPLFIYVIGIFVDPPQVQLEKKDLPSSVMLGETVEVEMTGKITGGLGALLIWNEVPEPFQLIEGNNYQLISKGFEEKRFGFSYKILCTKCGEYWLSGGWESRHILGLSRAHLSTDRVRQLKVLPPLPRIRKIKSPLHTAPLVHPSGSTFTVGPFGTDFKEIRNYIYGDPFKAINWKASARSMGFGKLNPLVNEYEREGKLSIWLFLDANPDLRIGTTVENALEYGAQVAYVLSHYFLNKGYSLGMYIYNRRGETLDFDTGKKQFVRIADRLLRLTPTNPNAIQVFWNEHFSRAVEKNRKYLISRKPGIITITHITSASSEDLLNGFRKILAYRGKRMQPNALIINVLPYSIVPRVDDHETYAARMLDVSSRSVSKQLRNLGLPILDWDPRKESIESVLLSTLMLR
jgi:uncharacterized protein (DUF58 family)